MPMAGVVMIYASVEQSSRGRLVCHLCFAWVLLRFWWKREAHFVSQSTRIVGYSPHGRLLTSQNAKRFSYNKRTMESAMVPFLPLWPYEESITYVLSTP